MLIQWILFYRTVYPSLAQKKTDRFPV